MRNSCAMILLACFCGGAAAQDPPNNPEEAIKAIRKGLARLADAERADTSYRCQSKISVFGVADGKPLSTVSSRDCRINRAGDKIVLHIDMQDDEAESASLELGDNVIINDSYMFAIRRLKAETPWMLTRFSRADRVKDFWGAVAAQRTALFPLTTDTLSTLLNETMDNPTFRATSVRTLPDGMIEIACSVDSGDERNKVNQSGTLVFSPQRHYALVGYDRTLTVNGAKFREQGTRVLSEPGQPLRCKSLNFVYTNLQTGLVSQRHEFEFSEHSSDAIPKEMFKLGFYGIPDPTDVDANVAVYSVGKAA
jgi:hypothetical protein